MSYRKIILKRLIHFYDDVSSADGAYLELDPIDIVGKSLPGKEGTKYVAAINQLVREGLVMAVPIGDKMAFSLNSNKIEDIKKELQRWRNPLIISTILALAGLVWAV